MTVSQQRMWSAIGISLAGVALTVGGAIAKPSTEPAVKPPSKATAKAAGAANQFGAKALAHLAGDKGDKTVVLSPYGIATVLNMLTFGAAGDTHDTLRAAIGPSRSGDWRIRIAHKAINRSLGKASTPAVTITTGNALWLAERSKLEDSYRELVADTFQATTGTANFAKPAALAAINRWASKATRGLIPQVVEQLDPATELVLANAVYFKGAWATAFDSAKTADAPFTRIDGSARTVAMMSARLNVAYAQGPGYHAVALPYAGGRFQMTVLTAEDPAQSAKFWADLRAQGISKVLAGLQLAHQPVNVRLPRFKTAFAAELDATLKALGLGPALGPGGSMDYTAMTPANLKAISVVHRTLLDISETGTEAAAVTAAISTRSLEPEPATFSADRPFVIAITDTTTGVMLFLGYIAEP